ncbi:MAG TPA: MmgE/PrpD family protein [Burkholderiales bacterium]|jgi:2-methylcitrate dehydratase|nr:MmgE/PrpD family protein [Burkholderiales bacterium]
MPITRRAFVAALAGAAAAPAYAQQSKPTANMAERMAAYAAGLRYTDLKPADVEAVKAHFIDAMACAMGAFNEAPVRAVRQIALANAGGPATVIGTKRRSTMDWAAFANGAALRHFDLNDAYAGKEPGHPSDNITPCLAVAEAEGRSGRDLILAIALAYEIDCHLLDAVRITARGWDHPNYSLPAAALAAGKLMNLRQAQLTEAVNLALAGHYASNQTRLQAISNWKGMADADAGRSAVFAAQLARGGITGPAPAFEGKAGFFSQVSGPFTLDFENFGGRAGPFLINACAYKHYPAQMTLQTAVPAAAKAGAAVGAGLRDPGQVKSILVHTTLTGVQYSADSAEKWAPETSETADHSLPYVVARAMLDGEITPASYSAQALHDPRVRALMAVLKVEEDPAFTAAMPTRLPTRVTVTLNDGRTVSGESLDLPGFGGLPMTRADVEAKFRRYVRGVWPEAQIRNFLDYAWNLEQQPKLTGLFQRMVVTA